MSFDLLQLVFRISALVLGTSSLALAQGAPGSAPPAAAEPAIADPTAPSADAAAPSTRASDEPEAPPQPEQEAAPVDVWSRTIKTGVKQEQGPAEEPIAAEVLADRRRIRPAAYLGGGVALLTGQDDEIAPAFEFAGGVRFSTHDENDLQLVLWVSYVPDTHFSRDSDSDSARTSGSNEPEHVSQDGKVWGFFPQASYRIRPLGADSAWYAGAGARAGISFFSGTIRGEFCDPHCHRVGDDKSGVTLSAAAVAQTGFLLGRLSAWDLSLSIPLGWNLTSSAGLSSYSAAALLQLGKTL